MCRQLCTLIGSYGAHALYSINDPEGDPLEWKLAIARGLKAMNDLAP